MLDDIIKLLEVGTSATNSFLNAHVAKENAILKSNTALELQQLNNEAQIHRDSLNQQTKLLGNTLEHQEQELNFLVKELKDAGVNYNEHLNIDDMNQTLVGNELWQSIIESKQNNLMTWGEVTGNAMTNIDSMNNAKDINTVKITQLNEMLLEASTGANDALNVGIEEGIKYVKDKADYEKFYAENYTVQGALDGLQNIATSNDNQAAFDSTMLNGLVRQELGMDDKYFGVRRDAFRATFPSEKDQAAMIASDSTYQKNLLQMEKYGKDLDRYDDKVQMENVNFHLGVANKMYNMGDIDGANTYLDNYLTEYNVNPAPKGTTSNKQPWEDTHVDDPTIGGLPLSVSNKIDSNVDKVITEAKQLKRAWFEDGKSEDKEMNLSNKFLEGELFDIRKDNESGSDVNYISDINSKLSTYSNQIVNWMYGNKGAIEVLVPDNESKDIVAEMHGKVGDENWTDWFDNYADKNIFKSTGEQVVFIDSFLKHHVRSGPGFPGGVDVNDEMPMHPAGISYEALDALGFDSENSDAYALMDYIKIYSIYRNGKSDVTGIDYRDENFDEESWIELQRSLEVLSDENLPAEDVQNYFKAGREDRLDFVSGNPSFADFVEANPEYEKQRPFGQESTLFGHPIRLNYREETGLDDWYHPEYGDKSNIAFIDNLSENAYIPVGDTFAGFKTFKKDGDLYGNLVTEGLAVSGLEGIYKNQYEDYGQGELNRDAFASDISNSENWSSEKIHYTMLNLVSAMSYDFVDENGESVNRFFRQSDPAILGAFWEYYGDDRGEVAAENFVTKLGDILESRGHLGKTWVKDDEGYVPASWLDVFDERDVGPRGTFDTGDINNSLNQISKESIKTAIKEDTFEGFLASVGLTENSAEPMWDTYAESNSKQLIDKDIDLSWKGTQEQKDLLKGWAQINLSLEMLNNPKQEQIVNMAKGLFPNTQDSPTVAIGNEPPIGGDRLDVLKQKLVASNPIQSPIETGTETLAMNAVKELNLSENNVKALKTFIDSPGNNFGYLDVVNAASLYENMPPSYKSSVPIATWLKMQLNSTTLDEGSQLNLV